MLSLAKIAFCIVSLVFAFLVQVPLFAFDFRDAQFENFSYSPALLLVFILTCCYKNNYAFMSLIVILIAVLFGLPLFSFGGGWQYILQPSFGFILAMILMSVIVFYKYHHTETREYFFRDALLALLAANLFGVLFFMVFNQFDFTPFKIFIYQALFDLVFAIIFLWLFKREV